ncbi:pyridoxamine 5'-phosphate oxidase [Rickenella mellea]|uniref:pyridoxal 5'-phosphate synthase n=1 Tax=Rickenella mellea TaxID=50990 RepID=A0A4Y7PRR7_9AGAM|nr:pyridoxamine 5'-phosphate oxidase [Rickenella mellea]
MDAVRITTHATYDGPGSLSPSLVAPDPLVQFRTWFSEAERSVSEPEAMAISTTSPLPNPTPSVRFVLLRTVDKRGFVFFTNYESRKAKELEAAPRAALAFYWREMHRQVRVVGNAERVSKEESEEYFKTRPLGSRIGAWASPQSQVIKEGEIEQRVREVRERFGVQDEATDKVDVPLPDFWGGWRIVPDEVEFWSGKPSRLHDRVRYTRTDEDKWKIERLAP